MSRQSGGIELESARLAGYSHQIPCYICEDANPSHVEFCRSCCAPMALAQQAQEQKVPPQIFAALGASGAGKTVYLGMLFDMLSRQTNGARLVARGSFSVTLQERAISAFSRGAFPDKTPNEPDRWNWVYSQIKAPGRRRPVDLIMPDLAGEAIAQEIERPKTYGALQMLLKKCAGVLILIDSTKFRDGSLDQDYSMMKLLCYLSELDRNPKTGWRQRPVAMVFTKADECEECFDNPDAFARTHFSGLWQQAYERFGRCRFFASGVAGPCAECPTPDGGYRRVPLRIEPRGIIEPFEWLIGQVK